MQDTQSKRILPLTLGTLGVVYGDLGTSPLYALHQVLPALSITEDNIFGVLSLVFWSLILVISTRYVTVFLNADNDGEGGIFALLSLLKGHYQKLPYWLFLIGILGAGLLLGDGMITPAISVISAIEGLKVISPDFSYLIVPLSFIILLLLYLFQYLGTGKIGSAFGPIILCWFITIGTLGGIAIYHNPTVLQAINPYYAFKFFYDGGWKAYLLLSGIFLALTGAEAMYTDLGHFGKTPIRIGWFAVALPALLLNYFGQGAYLLQNPDALSNVFYMLAPSWFSFPLLILATVATIIASQAIISASFSLANQAILLNVSPRLTITHTSKEEKGQVYVPQLNVILCIGTLLLVVFFRTSDALAGAYGIAINLVMICVAMLVMCVAHVNWKWSILKIIQVFVVFVIIDFAFLGANLHKILQGGWIPLLFAILCGFIMLSWEKGFTLLRSSYYMSKMTLPSVIKRLTKIQLNTLEDLTAIFITDPYDQSGGSLLHYLELNRIMPKQVLIVSVVTENRPYISEKNRFELNKLDGNIYSLIVHNGFMKGIRIPEALAQAEKMKIFPYSLDANKVYYLIETIKVIPSKMKKPLYLYWQKKLFTFLLHNSEVDVDFYHLPYNRTIDVGSYFEI